MGEAHTDKKDTNSLPLVFTGLEFMLWNMMRHGLGLCDEMLIKACLAKKEKGSYKGTGAHSQLKKIQASLSQTQPLPREEPR